jgi:hypothetical protein
MTISAKGVRPLTWPDRLGGVVTMRVDGSAPLAKIAMAGVRPLTWAVGT